MTSPKIYAAAALSLGLNLTAQAGNFGINTFTPGSQLSVKGNLSVGAGFASIPAPVNGALIEGQVVVGTLPPTSDVPLYIAGAGLPGGTAWGIYNNSNSTTWTPNFFTNPSTGIFSVAFISTNSGYLCLSDERVKNIVGKSDNRSDLETLRKIQVVDYTMKDQGAFGNRMFKKIIAQNVEKAYPLAIGVTSGFIPDIYAMSEFIEKVSESEYSISLPKSAHLALGDRRKLVTEKIPEVAATVIAITSDHRFTVKLTQPVALQDKVFVYGRLVDDLRAVDYDAIAMLNVSATQELAKQNEQLKQKQTEQTAKLALQEEKLSMIEAENTRLKAAVDDVESLKKAVAALQMKSETQTVALVK